MKNSNLPLFTAEYTLDITNVLQLEPSSFEKTINKVLGRDVISGNSIYPQIRLHFELTKDDPSGGGGGSNVPNDWGAQNPDLPTGNTGWGNNSNENYPGWHDETSFFRGAEVDFDECFSDCIASCDVEWDGRYNFRGKSTRSKLCAISCRNRCRNLSGVLV